MNKPELLTKSETADLLRVSVKTVERWEKDGILNPIRIARSVRYRRTDVQALIAGQQAGA